MPYKFSEVVAVNRPSGGVDLPLPWMARGIYAWLVQQPDGAATVSQICDADPPAHLPDIKDSLDLLVRAGLVTVTPAPHVTTPEEELRASEVEAVLALISERIFQIGLSPDRNMIRGEIANILCDRVTAIRRGRA